MRKLEKTFLSFEGELIKKKTEKQIEEQKTKEWLGYCRNFPSEKFYLLNMLEQERRGC